MSQVPPKFIKNRVTLQGQVVKVTDVGHLHISHEPVFSLPFSKWISKLRSSQHKDGNESIVLIHLLLGRVLLLNKILQFQYLAQWNPPLPIISNNLSGEVGTSTTGMSSLAGYLRYTKLQSINQSKDGISYIPNLNTLGLQTFL